MLPNSATATRTPTWMRRKQINAYSECKVCITFSFLLVPSQLHFSLLSLPTHIGFIANSFSCHLGAVEESGGGFLIGFLHLAVPHHG